MNCKLSLLVALTISAFISFTTGVFPQEPPSFFLVKEEIFASTAEAKGYIADLIIKGTDIPEGTENDLIVKDIGVGDITKIWIPDKKGIHLGTNDNGEHLWKVRLSTDNLPLIPVSRYLQITFQGILKVLPYTLELRDRPKLEIGEPNLQVDSSDTENTINLQLKATNLGKSACQKLSVKASDSITIPHVTIKDQEKIECLDMANGEHLWNIPLHFTSLPPGRQITRYLHAQLSDAAFVLRYSVTVNEEAPEPDFSWFITQPHPDWIPAHDPSITLAIKTGPRPGTNLKILNSELREVNTKQIIGPEELGLCLSQDCNITANQLVLPPNQSTSVSLIWKSLESSGIQEWWHAPVGHFSGQVYLIVDEALEPNSVPLNIYSSSFLHMLIGVVMLTLGVLAGLWINVFAYQRTLRLNALLPAKTLEADLDILEKEFEKLVDAPGNSKSKFPNIASVFEAVRKSLSEPFLDGKSYIPRDFKSAYNITPHVTANYQVHLEQQENKIKILEVIINEIKNVMGRWKDNLKQKEVVGALMDMDKLAPLQNQISEPKEVQQKAINIRLGLEKSTEDRKGYYGILSIPGLNNKLPLTRETILVQLASLNRTIWLAWAGLTVIIGWGALILINPGFGTPADWLECFLFGLGVQVTGHQLSQLSPSSLTSSLRITSPSGP